MSSFRPQHLPLIISLSGNILLLAFVTIALCRKSANSRPLRVDSVNLVSDHSQTLKPPGSRRESAFGIGQKTFQWRQVESTDYRQYIANLRAIGCPEETIRDIVIADVNKLYAPKLAALYSCAISSGSSRTLKC